METSLQSGSITTEELNRPLDTDEELREAEHHIHLPNPSLWPLILGASVLVTMIGLLFIPDNPWLTIFGGVFVFVGILGWALEDPMASSHTEEHVKKYMPSPMAQAVLDKANEVVEQIVTFSSTVQSTHPINVEMEREGVVLALYGKVELQAQRQALEEALLKLPQVIEVKNFVVAEDEILQAANTRLENMQAKGKLEGARDISILVENYILHLYGDVPTTDMKYALEREMVGIPGVNVVVNHIGLNTDIPGNLGKTRNK